LLHGFELAIIAARKGVVLMADSWETKYGSRRVRRDPPTLEEAIVAAQGLSDRLDEQIEIAAGFMDLPVEAVRAEVLKNVASRRAARVVTTGREGTGRTVIVERKTRRGRTNEV
jgi:hypothetical protein